MPVDDQILVSSLERIAYAKVLGRGSFKVSASLKEYGGRFLEQGQDELVIDLADCVGMDSTFMGVLAGLSVRCKKAQSGKIVLVNLDEKLVNLIKTLGLNHLVEFYLTGMLPEAYASVLGDNVVTMGEVGEEPQSEEARAKMMLESHVRLAELSPENRERFKDVITYLREEVDDLS